MKNNPSVTVDGNVDEGETDVEQRVNAIPDATHFKLQDTITYIIEQQHPFDQNIDIQSIDPLTIVNQVTTDMFSPIPGSSQQNIEPSPSFLDSDEEFSNIPSLEIKYTMWITAIPADVSFAKIYNVLRKYFNPLNIFLIELTNIYNIGKARKDKFTPRSTTLWRVTVNTTQPIIENIEKTFSAPFRKKKRRSHVKIVKIINNNKDVIYVDDTFQVPSIARNTDNDPLLLQDFMASESDMSGISNFDLDKSLNEPPAFAGRTSEPTQENTSRPRTSTPQLDRRPKPNRKATVESNYPAKRSHLMEANSSSLDRAFSNKTVYISQNIGSSEHTAQINSSAISVTDLPMGSDSVEQAPASILEEQAEHSNDICEEDDGTHTCVDIASETIQIGINQIRLRLNKYTSTVTSPVEYQELIQILNMEILADQTLKDQWRERECDLHRRQQSKCKGLLRQVRARLRIINDDILRATSQVIADLHKY